MNSMFTSITVHLILTPCSEFSDGFCTSLVQIPKDIETLLDTHHTKLCPQYVNYMENLKPMLLPKLNRSPCEIFFYMNTNPEIVALRSVLSSLTNEVRRRVCISAYDNVEHQESGDT